MSDYLINKLRKEVERCKNAGGMRAGLPTVKVDLYELERVLDMAAKHLQHGKPQEDEG